MFSRLKLKRLRINRFSLQSLTLNRLRLNKLRLNRRMLNRLRLIRYTYIIFQCVTVLNINFLAIFILAFIAIFVSSERVHVCVDNNDCGSQSIVGIDVEYNCVCKPGYTGKFCDTAALEKNVEEPVAYKVGKLELSRPARLTFYCEYKTTGCVNGVSEIVKKTAVCQ